MPRKWVALLFHGLRKLEARARDSNVHTVSYGYATVNPAGGLGIRLEVGQMDARAARAGGQQCYLDPIRIFASGETAVKAHSATSCEGVGVLERSRNWDKTIVPKSQASAGCPCGTLQCHAVTSEIDWCQISRADWSPRPTRNRPGSVSILRLSLVTSPDGLTPKHLYPLGRVGVGQTGMRAYPLPEPRCACSPLRSSLAQRRGQ